MLPGLIDLPPTDALPPTGASRRSQLSVDPDGRAAARARPDGRAAARARVADSAVEEAPPAVGRGTTLFAGFAAGCSCGGGLGGGSPSAVRATGLPAEGGARKASDAHGHGQSEASEVVTAARRAE